MLQGFWFGLIAVLWAGFFVLEGFDFGVGMLLPFVARTEQERDIALRTIGPVWDGNEVWLLVAGGATFAAFPEWYASMFSGFYLAFALLLAGLILRGIGIEYRGKAHTATGRRWCEAAVTAGSTLPALLLGVAFANIVRGLPQDRQHNITSGFFHLLSPYALIGGVVTLGLFLLHGALFLALRADGAVAVAATRLSRPLFAVVLGAGAAFLIWTTLIRGGIVSKLLAVLIVLALLAVLRGIATERPGRAFAASALTTALVPVYLFACLWPDVLPASNGAARTLTADGASSSHYTLVVMTVVAVLFTPIVLAYQAWTYWVFRARVGVPVGPTPGHDTLNAVRERAAGHTTGRAAPEQPTGAPGLPATAPDLP